MPPLSHERWLIVSPHLDRALDLPADRRAAWIESLRAEDPALAADLEALLEEHAVLSDEGFLAGEPTPLPAQRSLAGLAIGAYTLLSPLGQGGMGHVWLAERSDGRFQGRAAVKLLNASLIGREGEARFKREGSFLARLHHSHIAHLIDAGMSPLGQPYLILEYVDGERIDRYCDEGRLGIEARLRLFLDVLAAVGFAHTNLVVHRDLKPPNILVGRGGEVKLLDFGIAKLVEPEAGGTGTTALTREGGSALTPEYAAPEQLTGGPITTATDIYALGVILYVLLTGQHPGRPITDSPAEWVKAVVETQELRTSDAVVTTGPLPQAVLEENAARRSTSPKKLRRLLRGDLDNIVAKALKKPPTERYPSVESMADDLRRYLSNQPVSAQADSIAYRTAKFVRRHRGGVAAAGLMVAAVLAGTAGVAWQAREARIQRDAAQTQLGRATAANEFTAFLLSVAAPAGKKFNVGQLLDQSEILIDKQFPADDALKAEMLATVGQQYMLTEHYEEATRVLERAAAIAERGADPALRARVECPLALLKAQNSEAAAAEAMITRALTGLPEGPQYALQRAECLIRYSEFGFFDDKGEPMIARATAALEILDTTPSATELKRIDAQGTLAYGYYLTRQNQKADAAFAQVVRALERTGRDRTLAAADTLNNWALVHFRGDIGRAEPLLRRVLELRRSTEGGGVVAPTFTYNYAGALLLLGRYAEAEPLYEETIRTAVARKEWRMELDASMQLAELLIESGDLQKASAQLANLTPFLNDRRFNAFRKAQMAYYEGRLALAKGDALSARAHFTQSVDTFDKTDAKFNMSVQALIGLARAEQALGDTALAAATAERALVLAQSFVEPGSLSFLIGLSLAARGEIQRASGSTEAARASFKSAWEHLNGTLGPDHAATKNARQKAFS